MSKLFYNLGRKVGPRVRKAKWIWHSMTGTEADAVKIENDVGRDLAHEIRQQLKPDPDPQTEHLLGRIGPRLAACVANKFRTFSFETVKGGEPNAFALPGGFVFVTRSLVELCDADPDEMAHVIRGHAMDRIISNTAISTAARITPARGVFSGWLRKVGVRFLESAYSQDRETEADKLGLRLATAAEYDAHAAKRLLARLDGLARAPQKFYLGHYFSTHPPCKTRIRTINQYLTTLKT